MFSIEFSGALSSQVNSFTFDKDESVSKNQIDHFLLEKERVVFDAEELIDLHERDVELERCLA